MGGRDLDEYLELNEIWQLERLLRVERRQSSESIIHQQVSKIESLRNEL
jgi:hypothetical protein